MLRSWRVKLLLSVAMLTFRVPATGQIVDDSVQIIKGSYLHFGHAAIEDNSIYLEEAFNQAAGMIQFISGTVIINKTIETAFEIEIPLGGEKHQLSIGSSYRTSGQNVATIPNGLGDIRISYRPLLSGKHRWIMVIPRLTITLPRKNTPEEFSYHQPDAELAFALTKRFSKKITSHVNMGITYRHGPVTNRVFSKSVAGSLVWAGRPKVNFMLESVYTSSADEGGEFAGETIVNPAARFSFQLNHYQIVPALGFPVTLTRDSKTFGAFIYLSVEPF